MQSNFRTPAIIDMTARHLNYKYLMLMQTNITRQSAPDSGLPELCHPRREYAHRR
jgi:hypothetical protein